MNYYLPSQSENITLGNFTGFFRSVSILFFVIALIWCYAYMASQSDYSTGPMPGILENVDKDTYFFAAILLFLITNISCSWFIRTLKKIKTSEEGRGLGNRVLKRDLIGWTKGFAGVLNLFFSLVLVFLGLMTMSNQYNIQTLGFYVYLGPILIILWLFYLVVILGKRKSTNQ